MNNLLSRLVGDKKDWKRMEARAAELPADYRTVYTEMKNYLWRFTTGDAMDIVEILREILNQFETEAAAGRPVLEVTGTDLAAYCDARLPEQHDAYRTKLRTNLNEVAQKLS
jgi:DNA-binding ferritin-like protein (Dps family)